MLNDNEQDFDPLKVKCLSKTWGPDFFPNYQRVCLCSSCAQERMWKRMAEEDAGRLAGPQSPAEQQP